MAGAITCFRDVVELWPTREALAAELGVEAWSVSKWWQRKWIPSRWFWRIATSPVGRKNGVTMDLLERLAGKIRKGEAVR